jgi:hypothetical protein
MNPRNQNTAAFIAFAIRGTLDGKTPEQMADEYFELMGWNQPTPEPVESDESYEASEALLNARSEA